MVIYNHNCADPHISAILHRYQIIVCIFIDTLKYQAYNDCMPGPGVSARVSVRGGRARVKLLRQLQQRQLRLRAE